MRSLTAAERASIAIAKANIQTAKAALRAAQTNLTTIIDTWQASGDYAEEARAMVMQGHVGAALAELNKGHGGAMMALLDLFIDGNVVISGPGGR